MKKYRSTLFALVILAGLIVIYLFLDTTREQLAARPVFDVPPGGITALCIITSNGRIDFCKTNQRWSMQKPFAARVDQARLFSLERKLYQLAPTREFNRESNDLERFGLQNPSIRVMIETRDGSGQTLLIGAATPSRTEYYAADASLQRIYTLNKDDIDGLRGQPSDYRDKNLFAIESASVDFIRLSGRKQTWQLQKDSGGRWRMTLPVRAQVKGDRIRELLEKVTRLEIRDFIAGQEQPSRGYGLDKPLFTLTVKSKNGPSQSFRFGNETSDHQAIYFKSDRGPAVYTIARQGFLPESFPIDFFLDVAPLSVGIGEVNSIRVIDRGKALELIRDTAKPEEDVFTLAGQAVEMEDFNTLYINIMALSAAGYDPGNSGEKAPEFTVILKMKGNQNLRADFARRDAAATYFMALGGNPMPYYVTAAKITLVRQWLQRIDNRKQGK